MMIHCVIALLLSLPAQTLQRSHHDSPSYIAAVVEYSPISHPTDDRENSSDVNAKNYLKIIDKAASYGADIIVFPESGLAVPPNKYKMSRRARPASYIPDPADDIIPCTDKSNRYKYTLMSMSCAARDYKMYLLISHREKVDCTPAGQKGCGMDGFLIYNSNVAFDREGRVIAKYRKHNLYHEVGVNFTEPIPTTFTTDFGVTFGTFTCFDLIFAEPALNLVRELNITDILYPVHWFDLSPFLFATEAQAAWAYHNDVNFMAAGQNNPHTHSGGSGIYLGKQGYVDVISESKGANVLLVAEVPKIINGKRTLNIDRSKVHMHKFTSAEIDTSDAGEEVRGLLEDDSAEDSDDQHAVESVENTLEMLIEGFVVESYLSNFKTEWIDMTVKHQQKTVCYRGLCCNFNLTMDIDETSIANNSLYYRYRFAVFNESIHIIGAKTCAIVACDSDNNHSCGNKFSSVRNLASTVTFTSLEITLPMINSTRNDHVDVLPSTYTQNRIPLNVTDFAFTSADDSGDLKYHLQLTKPSNNLWTFAIIVNDSH